jgi:hypothetical protein
MEKGDRRRGKRDARNHVLPLIATSLSLSLFLSPAISLTLFPFAHLLGLTAVMMSSLLVHQRGLKTITDWREFERVVWQRAPIRSPPSRRSERKRRERKERRWSDEVLGEKGIPQSHHTCLYSLSRLSCGSVVASAEMGDLSRLVSISLGHGVTIAVLVANLSGISGGHINPVGA